MENNTTKFSLQCSPRIYHIIQEDQEYGSDLVQQVKDSMGNDFLPSDEFVVAAPVGNVAESEVIQQRDFLCDEISTSGETSFNEKGEGKMVWLEGSTKLLLMLLEKYQSQVGKKVELSNKKKMWQLISQKLHNQGYAFTEDQVQWKYRSFVRQYKQIKLHNTKTGRKKISPYQTELDNIFENNRGVFPEHNDDIQDEDVSREELITAVGIISEETSDIRPQPSTSEKEYGSDLVQQVKESNRNDFLPNDEFVFKMTAPVANDAESEVIQQQDFSCDKIDYVGAARKTSFNGKEEGKMFWLYEPTKLLLTLFGKYQSQVGKKFELSNKRKMWRVITQKLHSQGYTFTEAQVHGKFRSLERQYIKSKLYHTKSGRKRISAYQTELDNIFGNNRGVSTEHIDEELSSEKTSFPQASTSGVLHNEAFVQLTDPLEHCTVKYEVHTGIVDDEDDQSFQQNIVEGSKSVWLDSATNLLVSLVEKLSPTVGKSFNLYSKKKMWLMIRDKINEKGYHFTMAQVIAKYRSVERQYKKIRTRRIPTGSQTNGLFQQEVESILSNRKEVLQEFLLDESTASTPYKTDKKIQNGVGDASPKQSDGDLRNHVPKKKSSLAESILKELKESRAERKEFHNKVLQYLKNKEDRDEEMEKRARRREKMDQRKLELLEELTRTKPN